VAGPSSGSVVPSNPESWTSATTCVSFHMILG